MPPTQVTAGTDAISDHRREGTAREWEAGLIPHKLLLEVFFVARDLKKKKRPGCRLSYPISFQGDVGTVLPSPSPALTTHLLDLRSRWPEA